MIRQLNNQDYPAANRTYKDGLFRLVFQKKEDLLSLYNAVNGSDYSNPDELEINTLDNALYLSMKNDLAFLISGTMNLYEHQSTFNPNGTEKEPDRSTLKLSDSFYIPSPSKTPSLECIAIMLIQDSLTSLGAGFGSALADIIHLRIPAHPRGAYIRWGIDTRH